MERSVNRHLVEGFRPDLVNLRRKMLGLTQAELAQRSGLAQGTLSKLEQGLRPVSDAIVERLSDALDCPPSFFCRPDRLYGAPMSAHPFFARRHRSGVCQSSG